MNEKSLSLESVLDRLLAKLRATLDIDLCDYQRKPLLRRLETRMAQLEFGEPSAYLEYFLSHPAETMLLLDIFAIKFTSFFRDPFVFEKIAHVVLPAIIEQKRNSENREIRVWSAACATGEEAFSIAMLMHEALKTDPQPWRQYVFATDLSPSALKTAKRGQFNRKSLEATKLGMIDTYFTRNKNNYQIQALIQEMVHFSEDDLTSDKRFAPAESVFGSFDLILCRNVLIYFTPTLQHRVFDKIHQSLNQEGYLILGEAETLSGPLKAKFHKIDSDSQIYQKKK
ncbi:protein-glutamate O-methyltransferase CheR [Deltaproteobacteria bacterium TL4]